MSASSFPFDYTPRFSGIAAEIVARDDLWVTFRTNASARGFLAAAAAMELYVECGPDEFLPAKTFEKDFAADGRKARIEAFNGFYTRLYGFAVQIYAKPTFFITGLDLSQKAGKAKACVLDVAGNEAIRILKALG